MPAALPNFRDNGTLELSAEELSQLTILVSTTDWALVSSIRERCNLHLSAELRYCKLQDVAKTRAKMAGVDFVFEAIEKTVRSYDEEPDEQGAALHAI